MIFFIGLYSYYLPPGKWRASNQIIGSRLTFLSISGELEWYVIFSCCGDVMGPVSGGLATLWHRQSIKRQGIKQWIKGFVTFSILAVLWLLIQRFWWQTAWHNGRINCFSRRGYERSTKETLIHLCHTILKDIISLLFCHVNKFCRKM